MNPQTLAPPEAQVTLEPGLHPRLAFPDYLAIDAVSNSLLKEWDLTPAQAREKMMHPKEPTAALRTGDACHVAVFEPTRFKHAYARSPKFNLRTNKGKAEAEAWRAAHLDYAALLPDEYDLACALCDSVRSHPLTSELLKAEGQNELTVIWNDAETGLLCKARIDRLTSYMGWTIVVDLKTCKLGEASVNEWPRICAKFWYHQQAAFYLDGLNTLAPHERRFIFMAVEKEAPYLIAHHEPDESAIAEGRARYRAALDKFIQAKETGEYPGYAVGIEGFDIPKWAYQYTRPPR